MVMMMMMWVVMVVGVAVVDDHIVVVVVGVAVIVDDLNRWLLAHPGSAFDVSIALQPHDSLCIGLALSPAMNTCTILGESGGTLLVRLVSSGFLLTFPILFKAPRFLLLGLACPRQQ